MLVRNELPAQVSEGSIQFDQRSVNAVGGYSGGGSGMIEAHEAAGAPGDAPSDRRRRYVERAAPACWAGRRGTT